VDSVEDGPEDSESGDLKLLNERLSESFRELIAPGSDPEAVHFLCRYVRSLAGQAPLSDVDDVVSKVLVGLITRLKRDEDRPEPEPIERPAAYLRAATRNALKNLEGRREQAESVGPERLEYLADLLGDSAPGPEDVLAARQLMDLAMEHAMQIGDMQAVKLAIVWEDLDDVLGTPPSSRELGDVIGLSHTQVGRILRRLGAYAREVSRE
jgi:hypothetical protein